VRIHGLPFLTLVALGCQATGVQGLEPREPVQIDIDVWPDILTLRPTFRWAPFPGPEDERIYGEEIAQLENVRYDLIVVRASEDLALVYERSGLTTTEHEIEIELEPGTRHHWSVRTRFELRGRTRVTPWSTLGPLGYRNARRLAQTPNPWLFRFETKTDGPQNSRRAP
jgi:hypothetical protein